MHCPRLEDLPAAPAGKVGWPWTEEISCSETPAKGGSAWPRITIVTPSFNQGRFLEETIRSVLLQHYPNLEYIVMDGGSCDNSVDIIKKYAQWLTYWASEPDGGQSAAINRGLKLGTGFFAGWINSDDLLDRDALLAQVSRHGLSEKTIYAGICTYLNSAGTRHSAHQGKVHSLEDLVSIRTVWRAGGQIVQPEVLFPRQLFIEVGGLEPGNHRTMDYELWGKFLLAGATFKYTDIQFAMFREHDQQKTHDMLSQTNSLIASAKLLVSKANFSDFKKNELFSELDQYLCEYEKHHWLATGRLARFGVQRDLVVMLRRLGEWVKKRRPIRPARLILKPTSL
jgi:glycosyltransferase involved in cell wall biosynthesis